MKNNQTKNQMRNNRINFTKASIFTVLCFIASCSKKQQDTPAPVNEEEVITTLKVTLTSGDESVTLQSKDSDGTGPNAPKVTVLGDLKANTTYTGKTEFLNETETPVEDVTEEVKKEKDDHQVFYIPTNNIVTITYTDKDSKNMALGLAFTLTTTEAKTGKLTVILRHEPTKNSENDIAKAGGETDIEATFDITVK